MALGDKFRAAEQNLVAHPYALRQSLAKLIAGEDPTGAPYNPLGGPSASRRSALAPAQFTLGLRRQARFSVVVHGDSTDEGIGANSNDRARAWPTRLAASLRQNRYSAGGEIIDPGHVNYLPVSAPGSMHSGGTINGTLNWMGQGSAPWPSVPTGWILDEARGAHGYSLRSDGSGAPLTITIPTAHSATTIQLVYRRGPNASDLFTVSVNGTQEGAAGTTTLTPSNGTARDGTFTGIKNISSGTAYTVVITPAAGATPTINGMVVFGNNYNRGIVVNNISKGGSRAKDWLDLSEGGKGWAPIAATADSGVNGLVDLNPDLIVRGGFYNDMQSSAGVSAASYKTQEQALIARMRATLPTKTVPVVLLTKWKPADAYLADPVSRGRIWEDYVAARDQIAAEDPFCLHVNMSEWVPRPASTEANGYALGYLDNVHGGDKIYGFVGDYVADFITNTI